VTGPSHFLLKGSARCAVKPQCTRSREDRRITRWAYEEVLEQMNARVQAEPEKVKLRKTFVEHPYGTLKHHWNQGSFLMKGLPNVGAEMSLTVMAYNLKRAINILGVPRLVEALA